MWMTMGGCRVTKVIKTMRFRAHKALVATWGLPIDKYGAAAEL